MNGMAKNSRSFRALAAWSSSQAPSPAMPASIGKHVESVHTSVRTSTAKQLD